MGVVVIEVELKFLCKRHKFCIQYYRHHLVCWIVGRMRYWVGDSQTGSWSAFIKVWVEPSEFSTFIQTFHFSVFLKGLLCVVFLFDFRLDGLTRPVVSHLNNAPVEFLFVPIVRKRSKKTFIANGWVTDLIFVTNIILLVEKKLSCGEISAFHVWQLWGNWEFLHMWRNFRCHHMTDVDKSEILHIWNVCDVQNIAIYAKFMHFFCNLGRFLLNLLFTLFCREIYFATIYVLSCGEKLSPKVHLWRKNDKYQVWWVINLFCCGNSFPTLELVRLLPWAASQWRSLSLSKLVVRRLFFSFQTCSILWDDQAFRY